MLKKFFAVTLTVLISITPLFLTPPIKASGALVYGRAITENVGFYKDENATDLLFYLPYTYYVKITEYGASVSRVEIFSSSVTTPALDGYVYTDTLYFEDVPPVTPFYELTLTTANTTPFYAENNASTVMRYIFENRTLSCYGHIQNGNGDYLYYVCYNGSLGYVKEENIVPFTFVAHPNPLPVFKEETPTEPTPEKSTNKTSDVLRIAIIVSIALAGITILAFAVKPEKKKAEVTYFDDNDYD